VNDKYMNQTYYFLILEIMVLRITVCALACIIYLIQHCKSLEPSIYTVEKETKTFSQQQQQKDLVNPIKSRSPIECILKCRIQLMESFYVENEDSELNCYCVYDKNDKINLSSSTRTSETPEEVDVISFNQHQVGSPVTPIKSCKDVKKKCPECRSGFYTLQFAEPTKTFCDMETDNGGWTLIGNLTFDDPTKVTEISNTIFDSNNGRLSDISKASEGRFLLDTIQYGTLAEHTGFKELRVRCFKPWHGRSGHFVMKGDSLRKMLFQSSVIAGLCGNNMFRFLADDTSVAKSTDCSQLRSKQIQPSSVYNHLLWVADTAVYQLDPRPRFECDDWIVQSGFTQIGSWQFYVR